MRLCAAVLCLLALIVPGAGNARPDRLQRAGEAIVERAWVPDGPGGAVIATRGGRIVFAGARGLANITAKRPVTLDTVFRFGSVTKQFTAALVLRLAEEGKLSLDDRLDKFVPGYPQPGGKATIRQLLNHSSGIQSYTFIPGWEVEANFSRAHSTQDMIAVFRDYPPQFQPGADFAYNNSGYVLLAAVIEAVTGQPWHVALRERITGPLGLASVRYGGEEAAIADRALPYSAGPAGVRLAPRMDLSTASGAGSLVGSVRDLARWAAALHHGKVVRGASYAQMTAPTTLSDGRSMPYGFGLAFEAIRGIKAIAHSGTIAGGLAESVYLPDRDIFVAVLANNDTPAVHPAAVARQLVALVAGRPIPVLDAVPFASDALTPLFGVYADGASQRRFYLAGGQLRLLADERERTVFHAGANRFFLAPPYELDWFEIRPAPSGGQMMEFHDSTVERVHRSTRIGEMVQPTMARSALERFTGRYAVAGSITIISLGSSGGLTVKVGDRPPVDLRLVSTNQFAADRAGAYLTFEGEGAKTARLRSRIGVREVIGTRITDAVDVE